MNESASTADACETTSFENRIPKQFHHHLAAVPALSNLRECLEDYTCRRFDPGPCASKVAQW